MENRQKPRNENERNGRRKSGIDSRNKGSSGSGSSNTKCRNCGGSYPHEGSKTCCPSYQKECNNCGKLGHFKSVCRSELEPKCSGRQRGNLRALEEDLSDSNGENAFRISIHSVHGNKAKHPLFKVKIGKTWLTIMADSGSSINILDENDYNKLQSPPKLEVTFTRVYPCKSNKPLKMLAKFMTTITTTDRAISKTAHDELPSRDDSPMFLTSPFTFMLITVIDFRSRRQCF